jgi:DNA-3-methyladenine glycosylase
VTYHDDPTNWSRLPREFYLRTALEVAPSLLGMVLVHVTPQGTTAGIICETEAYQGPEDKACHAYGGRRTPRTEVMYKEGGHAYVYFTYGMHYLFNAVVAEKNVPHAVLIRSIFPIWGENLMLKRRSGRHPIAEGPGRLCQAMGIDRSQNEIDLTHNDSPLFIAKPPNLVAPPNILITPRIGIDNTGEAKHYLWRFMIPHEFHENLFPKD